MTNKGYPKEITEDNLPTLVKTATAIRKKANWAMFVFGLLYSIIANIIVFLGFPLWGFFVVSTSKSMTPEVAFATIIISFVIVYVMSTFLLLVLLEALINRAFGLKFDEWVFGECVLIISHLKTDKTKAIKDINDLVAALNGLLRNSPNNSRAKMFSPVYYYPQWEKTTSTDDSFLTGRRFWFV